MIVERLSDQYDLIIDPRIADWVAAHIPDFGTGADFGPCEALGIGMGGEIIGGVVYNNWQPAYKSIELTAAATSPTWLGSRATARALLAYPFEQLGVGRISTFTRASNERALKLNRLLGFREEGRVRLGYGDEDAVLMGLLRCEAPAWLKLSGGDNRQARTKSSRPLRDGGCSNDDEQGHRALQRGPESHQSNDALRLQHV